MWHLQSASMQRYSYLLGVSHAFGRFLNYTADACLLKRHRILRRFRSRVLLVSREDTFEYCFSTFYFRIIPRILWNIVMHRATLCAADLSFGVACCFSHVFRRCSALSLRSLIERSTILCRLQILCNTFVLNLVRFCSFNYYIIYLDWEKTYCKSSPIW